jgi:cell division protein FtsW (lipid II flippase)
MTEYIKKYDKYIKSLSEDSALSSYDRIIENHLIQIKFLQHERLVHLLVTLFFALFLFISFAIALFTSKLLFYIICFILMVVLIFYIFHYYLLENTVQRWYHYYNILSDKRDANIKNNK